MNLKKNAGIWAVLGILLITPVQAASSLSRHGVTWTFDRNYVTGTYVNGDHWVVGPVVITKITPGPQDGRNGTMINPGIGTQQGFDEHFIDGYNDYVSSLNVGRNLPLSVPVNSSVVSSITADAYVQFGTIEMFSILTVVSSAPASGSFRPPAIGSGSRSSQWNESQISYSRLNRLARAPLSAIPDIDDYEDWFSYPWLEMNATWTGRYVHPTYMAPSGYGKDIAFRTGDAALLLNLDFSDAQKRPLLIGMIQTGIDNYGFLAKGGNWFNDGGHNIGRLAPLIISAGVLNDANMKEAIMGEEMGFQEFQTTFFVSQTDVNLTNRVGTNGQEVHQYRSSDIGMPEWGIRHSGSPNLDNNFWGALYRDINGASHTAPTMAAKVMGLRSTIQWEPLFQYAERHLNYEQSSSYGGEFNYNATPSFHKQFYNTYKNVSGLSGVEPPVETEFAIGDRIKLTAATSIRSSGTSSSNVLGSQSANATGTIVGGPVGPDSSDVIWWQVNWDTGVDGWAGEVNYGKLTGALAPLEEAPTITE